MEGEGSEGPVAARLPQLEWACLSTDGLSDIRLRLVELARRLLRGGDERLFYIVTQVKRGRGYREIGHSMGIAHGRARNLVFEAYKRLGVHKYTEIGKFVW